MNKAIVIIGGALTVVAAGRITAGRGDAWKARVAAAGCTAKTARIGDVDLAYAEGPDNGPPLLLLHAQHMDRHSYSRVLPALVKRFHVFAVDYPAHGITVVPEGYPMTADRIGADLASFIETTIGAPAYVTGNSSGGLLTAWVAANRPDLVRAIVLEDPPLFAAEYPRSRPRSSTDRSLLARTPSEMTSTTSCRTGSTATAPFSPSTLPRSGLPARASREGLPGGTPRPTRGYRAAAERHLSDCSCGAWISTTPASAPRSTTAPGTPASITPRRSPK